MIKLIPLLVEIVYRSVWKTEGNAPHAVINVLHKIIAILLRQNKDVDPDKYVRIHNLSEGDWVIENLRKKHILLVYGERKNQWEIYGPHALEKIGTVQGKRINTRQLNHIIKHWTI